MNSLFPTKQIKILTDNDFLLNSEEKITIKDNSLLVILFYDKTDISNEILKMWDNILHHVSGPIFCICDMTTELGVSQNFKTVASDISSKYHKLAFNKEPFIIVYKNGNPVKNYKNAFSETKLIIFTTNLIDMNFDKIN